jgi:hypothetical protein
MAIVLDTSNDIHVYRSQSGGSWTHRSSPGFTPVVHRMAVWNDTWTEGFTDKRIHTAFIDNNPDGVHYWYYDCDTNTHTLTSVIDETSCIGLVTSSSSDLSLTKALSGRMYIHWWCDAGGEYGFIYCQDTCTTVGNWKTVTGAHQGNNPDRVILVPAYTDDPNDISAIYLSETDTKLYHMGYDASTDTWPVGRTITVDSSIAMDTTLMQVDACPRHGSDDDVIVVAAEPGYGTPVQIWEVETDATPQSSTWAISDVTYNESVACLWDEVNSRLYVQSTSDEGSYADDPLGQCCTSTDCYAWDDCSTAGGQTELSSTQTPSRKSSFLGRWVGPTDGGIVGGAFHDNTANDADFGLDEAKTISVSAAERRAFIAEGAEP